MIMNGTDRKKKRFFFTGIFLGRKEVDRDRERDWTGLIVSWLDHRLCATLLVFCLFLDLSPPLLHATPFVSDPHTSTDRMPRALSRSLFFAIITHPSVSVSFATELKAGPKS